MTANKWEAEYYRRNSWDTIASMAKWVTLRLSMPWYAEYSRWSTPTPLDQLCNMESGRKGCIHAFKACISIAKMVERLWQDIANHTMKWTQDHGIGWLSRHTLFSCNTIHSIHISPHGNPTFTPRYCASSPIVKLCIKPGGANLVSSVFIFMWSLFPYLKAWPSQNDAPNDFPLLAKMGLQIWKNFSGRTVLLM